MSVAATLSVVRLPMQRAFGHAQATRNVTENVILELDLDVPSARRMRPARLCNRRNHRQRMPSHRRAA